MVTNKRLLKPNFLIIFKNWSHQSHKWNSQIYLFLTNEEDLHSLYKRGD